MNEKDLAKLYPPAINLTEMSPERINNLIKDLPGLLLKELLTY